jgi:uncharacterized protein DUF4350
MRLALGTAAALVAVNVALAAIGSLDGGTPGGPRSSSYATGADGAAAYAELLREAGYEVTALRSAPSERRLDPAATAVALDAVGVTLEDAVALRMFVQDGGRLVVGGDPGRWLEGLGPGLPAWGVDGSNVARTVAPVAETRGVDRVEAAGDGTWRGGRALPVVIGETGSLVSVQAIGAGRLVLLADVSPLQNERLAAADNAALGLGIAGPRERRVLFAETYHGYGEASGIGAIPDAWLAAIAIGLVAIATLMLARGRRLGPPEPDARALAPARSAYVDALGALLARRRDRTAAGVALQARAAGRLTGAPPEALAQPVATDSELVAVGAAFAAVERSIRRNA